MGTPQQPIKCTIDIDIDRTWNDLHNEQRMVTMNDSTKRLSTNDYDAGVILAGNHEGAMYAASTLSSEAARWLVLSTAH